MAKTTKRTLEIGGTNFTVYERDELSPFTIKGDLSACYERPSNAKCAIYSSCVDRTLEIEKYFNAFCYDFGVSSYNCMMFTYAANITKDGELIAVYYETKTRRELYVKKGVCA